MNEPPQDPPLILLKGGIALTPEQAKDALDEAMTIIECVGTVAIYERTQAAGKWMKRYYPNWT